MDVFELFFGCLFSLLYFFTLIEWEDTDYIVAHDSGFLGFGSAWLGHEFLFDKFCDLICEFLRRFSFVVFWDDEGVTSC